MNRHRAGDDLQGDPMTELEAALTNLQETRAQIIEAVHALDWAKDLYDPSGEREQDAGQMLDAQLAEYADLHRRLTHWSGGITSSDEKRRTPELPGQTKII